MQLSPGPDRVPRNAIVLMYHAVTDGAVPAGQDPHYTLGRAAFERQLDQVARTGGACAVRDWTDGGERRPVLLTFDDGHESNHRLAFPALVERGLRADFFVNPANVGRPGFCGWAELRGMAAAGMSIQSHGDDHTWFTDMDARTLRERLRVARQRIEDGIGQAVTLVAPPGGRMPPGLPALARECGYRHVVASRPGRLPRGPAPAVVPRLAVTSRLDASRFERWLAGRAGAVLRERLRYGALALAKRALGERGYERARAHALSWRGS